MNMGYQVIQDRFIKRVGKYGGDTASVVSGLVTLTVGAISAANDSLLLGISLTILGITTINNVREHSVKCAKSEGFKEAVLLFLNQNGTNVTVVHRNDGAMVSVAKGDEP
jgi:hypothetical protein